MFVTIIYIYSTKINIILYIMQSKNLQGWLQSCKVAKCKVFLTKLILLCITLFW